MLSMPILKLWMATRSKTRRRQPLKLTAAAAKKSGLGKFPPLLTAAGKISGMQWSAFGEE
jgi:hypothetical protein